MHAGVLFPILPGDIATVRTTTCADRGQHWTPCSDSSAALQEAVMFIVKAIIQLYDNCEIKHAFILMASRPDVV